MDAMERTRARPYKSLGNKGGEGCSSSRNSRMASDCVSGSCPSSTNAGMDPSGLIFRNSALRCSPASRSMFCSCALRPFKLRATRTRNAADERQKAKSSNCACSDMVIFLRGWTVAATFAKSLAYNYASKCSSLGPQLEDRACQEDPQTPMPGEPEFAGHRLPAKRQDRKSTRLNSSHI